MSKTEFVVTDLEKGRVDGFLANKTEYTRSHVKNLCDNGHVLVNDVVVKANKQVKEGDVVKILVYEPQKSLVEPKDIPIDIIYQDDDLAVVNKPQGLTVHAGNGTDDQTLVNALLFHLDKLSGINGVVRPGIVHRIDKNTSGLLVVAKNDLAHVELSKQISDKTCKRIYLALLEGVVKKDKGTISTFINRNPADRTKMAVSLFGREAVTDFKVIERYKNHTLCEFSLRTGRTHQIRVHAKHMGHPVVGDTEYGFKNQKFKLNGQLLHAYKLMFIHPTTKECMEFTCDLPEHFKKILKKI